MISMMDVPGEVWDRVYEKWTLALWNGWDDQLWNSCKLCQWILSEDLTCRQCPLVENGWCDEGSWYHSRLCCSDIDDVFEWREDVIDFLEFIRPYTYNFR